jgi:inosine triphosphate pyrophosphatase
VPTVAAAAPTSATISAAPQLRDLRKETTVFVPRAAQRKKAAAGPAVNAAPGRNANEDEEGDVRVVPRPAPASGLMGKLSSMLGPTRPDTDEGEDEYEAFLEGVE